MTQYSWVDLSSICPLDLSDLKPHASAIEQTLGIGITSENLNEMKEKLIVASGELEILISRLLSLLYDVSILQTDTDKAIYSFMRDDVSRYLGMVDEKQNLLLEVFDGMRDERVGIGRTSAFKKIIQVGLYSVVYYSLKFASVEYSNYHPPEGQKKELGVFFKILYLIMSATMSSVGGIPRNKAGGGVGINKSGMPMWKALLTKKGEDKVKEEYKERYNEEFPSLEGDEDLDLGGDEGVEEKDDI